MRIGVAQGRMHRWPIHTHNRVRKMAHAARQITLDGAFSTNACRRRHVDATRTVGEGRQQIDGGKQGCDRHRRAAEQAVTDREIVAKEGPTKSSMLRTTVAR
jgi:hypothetical protein